MFSSLSAPQVRKRRPGRKVLGVVAVAALVLAGVTSVDAVAAPTSPGQSILGWGDNTYGETSGIASLAGHDVVAISAGDFYSLALKSDGTVVAEGYNADGRATVPPGLTGVIAISAGGDHSLALKSDGTVVAWGGDGQGDANVPAGLTGVTAISAGDIDSLALKSDGTVVGWGYGPDGATVPPGLTGVTAISAGNNSALALTSDGNVVAWGSNGSGQLDVPALPTGLTYTAVSSGNGFSVALRSDGTVVAWGYDGLGETDVPTGLSGVVAISATNEDTVALKSDGTVVAWGSNQSGDTVVPPGLTHVSAISAGYAHSLVLVPTLTVTASARVLYGSGPATLAPSYSGFVDGDDSSVVTGVTCSAPVDATTPPGTYPATCTGGSAPGYVLNYVPGTVTVTAPSQTIAFPAVANHLYGDADFDPGATASSGLPVSYTSTTPEVCSIVSNEVHIIAVGTCTVTASQAGGAGYPAATPVSQSFTVAKAPIRITASAQRKLFTTTFIVAVHSQVTGAPVAGAPVTVTAVQSILGAKYSCHASTAANGAATCTVTSLLPLRPDYTVTVSATSNYLGGTVTE